MIFQHSFVYVALTFSDGECRVMSFITRGRGSALPEGAKWEDQKGGIWTREPTNKNIFSEISKFPVRDADGVELPTIVKYRMMAEGENPLKEAGYRAARYDDGTRIVYDMEKLRECHRVLLRYQRRVPLADLDIEWSRAMAQSDTARAAQIELQRQKLRDCTADPRIDAATTLEELKQIGL